MKPDDISRRIAKLQEKYPPPPAPRTVFHPDFGKPEKISDGVWYETGYTREIERREFPFIFRRFFVRQKEYAMRVRRDLFDPDARSWIFDWFDETKY